MFIDITVKNWLKAHWLHIAIGTLFVCLIIGNLWQKRVTDNIVEENRLEYERHIQDIDDLRQIHQDEMQAQRALTKQLQEDLTRIESDYNERMANLETRLRSRRQTTVQETTGNPDEMARRLRERFGWRIQQ